jgi:hypothetical protein
MKFKKNSFFNTAIARSIKPIELINRKLNLICLSLEYDNIQSKITDSLTEYDIVSLRENRHTFLIIDYSKEGYSYKENQDIFKVIHDFVTSQNINSNKILYISSNLKEENSLVSWKKEFNLSLNLNIIPICYWLDHTRQHLTTNVSINETVKHIKEKKNFLSLNRRIKEFRVLTLLKIYISNFYDNTTISFDYLDIELLKQINTKFNLDIDLSILKSLSSLSPKFLDTSSFDKELSNTNPIELFQKTLVSLVSETLSDDWNNTSLFYSEKTFKPIGYNHPIIIFGQVGANSSLIDLGFRNYNKYFDLSFDAISCNATRLSNQILILEKLNCKLNTLTVDQKIEWLLQDSETLEYNKQALRDNAYNKMQGNRFLSIIDQLI